MKQKLRIALINPVTQTVNRPKSIRKIFGAAPIEKLETDQNIHFIQLSKQIADIGHKVTVFISDVYKPRKSTVYSENLNIRYLKTRCKWLFPPAYIPLTMSLYGEIKRGNFDIIQSSDFFSPSTVIAAIASKRIFVWQEMDNFPTRWLPRIISKLFYKTLGRIIAKKIIFIPRSSSAADFLKSLSYPKISDKIHTGVNTKHFYPINSEEKYILVVTRLAHDKGLEFLLKAFSKIYKEEPDIKLLIKGSGPYYHNLMKHIDKIGLTDRILIDTEKSDPEEMNVIYNKAFLTLIPGWGGILPFTAYESLAVGKPVISRFGRGLRDIIVDGKTGFITNSPSDMAEKITRLLKNSEERKKMGINGRNLILNFDLERIAKKFIKNYEKETN